jgi:hypothetical protein
VYKGEWKNDKMDGLGTFSTLDALRYLGEFKNGKIHGQGIAYSLDGKIKKEGIWDKGKFLYAQIIQKTDKQYSETSYDDLYASRREAEREKKDV